jgi:hypothetical protein
MMQQEISPEIINKIIDLMDELKEEALRLNIAASLLDEKAAALWDEDENQAHAFQTAFYQADRNELECKILASNLSLFLHKTQTQKT